MSKFMNRPPPSVMSTATLTNSSTYVEKLMIGLDHAPPSFDLRTQIIGVGGANLIYITNETGAIATLRGRGSQFNDPVLGIESPEPMHLYIEHTRLDALQNAKQLARNLIETLQQELAHFQQLNPPGSVPTSVSASVQSIQYSQQPVQNMQATHTQVISTQPVIPQIQMSVPPPNIIQHQPPPSIQNVEQMTTLNAPLVQQSNIVSQNTPTMVTAQHNQPQLVQQQILSGNMVIQQPIQTSLPTNLNVPPPNSIISMKQGHIVPSQVQLSQPPPNIHLQQQPTQIVLNQPPTNYQYIQQAPQDAGHQQNVTIQHIYQSQGIVQQTQPINTFTTQQTTVRPPSQQYILQTNTPYPCITAVPPPNIIQHQPPPMQPVQAQQQNIIFQTAGQIPLQQLQFHPPPNIVEAQTNPITSNDNDADNIVGVKDEKSSPEPNDITRPEEKADPENHEENVQANGPNISMQMPPPIRFTSTPIMTVPPPISCVQHIVGNTLITSTQPTGTQTHQIYNPVSLQQIQAAAPPGQQQIHVSSPGQHFLVNAQYPQQTFQQVQQVPQNVQSFQLTTASQARSGPNEIVMVSNQAIIAPVNQTTAQQPTRIFNPHLAPPTVTGMSVQFQQVMQPQVVENTQIIDQSHQSNFQTQMHQQQINENQQKLNGIPVPYPQQMEDSRMGLKRKRNGDDDHGPPKHLLPRMGMG
ncbi:protein RIK-like isoform X2 [Contarinia nasturtii]|nr:protein RIK-like isoform X2 [Contarinia nasturtii]